MVFCLKSNFHFRVDILLDPDSVPPSDFSRSASATLGRLNTIGVDLLIYFTIILGVKWYN